VHVPLSAPAVLRQLIPVGADVTVPVPLPPPCTVRLNGCCPNVAVTLRAWSTVTAQGAVPEQLIPDPLQPLKTEPVAGVAVSVTAVALV